MHSEIIHYNDLDGNPAQAEYHFYLGKGDLAEMDLVHRGDLTGYLEDIVKNKDGSELIKIFKELLLRSVGHREGMRFVRNQDIVDEFCQTGAYEALFLQLVTNEDAGLSFFRKIMPPDLIEKASAIDQNREYTDDELLTMSDADFARVAGRDPKNMSKRHLMIGMQRKQRVA